MCCLGAFSGLTGVIEGCRWRCDVRWTAMPERSEERFALAANDLSVLAADLCGSKMDV
jgi:hypothetical protein